MPPRSSDSSNQLQPRSLCCPYNPQAFNHLTAPPSTVSPPLPAPHKQADPQRGSPRAARGTFGLGVVHCKHVDGHKLEHAGASDGRGAVLQQDLELPQHLLSHRRERLHPADRERVSGYAQGCRVLCWHSWGRGTPLGAVSHPGAATEAAEAFLRERVARDCCVTSRQHSFGRKTRPL